MTKTATALLAALITAASAAAASGEARLRTDCSGGAQEAIAGQTRNFPAITAATSFANLAATTIQGGPSGYLGDSDLYVVTLSGEAMIEAGGGTFEVRMMSSADGRAYTPMPPGVASFSWSMNPETRTMTWCQRIHSAVSTSFRAQWRKVGGGNAVLDNYAIIVTRFD